MGNWTDFLYARPTFLEGLARILDLGGTLEEYNVSSSPSDADTRALQADWLAIGDDLKQAVRLVQAEAVNKHA
jgi:hypothetical protein